MENSLYVSLSRQMAMRSQMDVIANNVANMSTPGYRGQNMVFTEFLKKDPLNAPKPEVKGGLSMVLDYGHYQSTAAGPMRQTGNPLDVALEGKGFFGVQTNEGILYTRAGNFQINSQGQLITGAGDLVAGEGGAITVPAGAKDITIRKDGSISTDRGDIGRLMIVEFENDQDLEATGRGLYRAKGAFAPAENTRAIQGMVEDSNVQPVLEMTRMIDILRSYQQAQSMIQTEHERERTMIQRMSRT